MQSGIERQLIEVSISFVTSLQIEVDSVHVMCYLDGNQSVYKNVFLKDAVLYKNLELKKFAPQLVQAEYEEKLSNCLNEGNILAAQLAKWNNNQHILPPPNIVKISYEITTDKLSVKNESLDMYNEADGDDMITEYDVYIQWIKELKEVGKSSAIEVFVSFDALFKKHTKSMLEVAYEYIGNNSQEADGILIFGIADTSIPSKIFYRINRELVDWHFVNDFLKVKIVDNDEQKNAVAAILKEDVSSLNITFNQESRELPMVYILFYDLKTRRFDCKLFYNRFTGEDEIAYKESFDYWLGNASN